MLLQKTDNQDSSARSGRSGQTASVTRSTAVMSTATFISRITGFIRTWAMAFALGNTVLTAAFTVANNLPNQIFELLAGGIISSVFLPVYLDQREKRGEKAASEYASSLFSISLVVLGSISVLATIFAPQVVFTQTFLSQGLRPEVIDTAVFFFRFFAIQVLFYGIGGLLNSLLNAHREFLWPMLGPIFNNLVVIVTLFVYPLIAQSNSALAMVWLASGTTLGVAVMLCVQIPALIRLRVPLRFHIRLRDTALKESLYMALPVTIFVTVNLIVTSVLNAVALQTASNGTATIQYAWLWYQLPYGVIAVALSTALFTEMSEASAAGNMQKLRDNIRFGLRTTLFTIVPLAMAILVLTRPLAGLYHAGEFTYDDVLIVAQVLAVWCLALPFYATYRFLYRAFSSLRDLKAFIVVDACGRVIQVFLYGFLTSGFGIWPGLGLIGLPLADAIAHFLLLIAMLLVLERKIGSYGLKAIVVDGLKAIAAAGLAAALPLTLSRLGWAISDSGIVLSLISVLAWGVFILVAYYWICRLFKLPEVEFVNRLLNRAKRVFKRKKPVG
ncbi:MAG: murein biosynthesis integral membrane protein MurJ [Coriobacteriales bacterium]|jgi:putative peptidoglycan lipid II flippase|nr:murein biosynthesis integral membrane protein MurJ [Coriobacteriales bacterium]